MIKDNLQNQNLAEKVKNLADVIQKRSGGILLQKGEPSSNPPTISSYPRNQEENNSKKLSTDSPDFLAELINLLKIKYCKERKNYDPDLRKLAILNAEYTKLVDVSREKSI